MLSQTPTQQLLSSTHPQLVNVEACVHYLEKMGVNCSNCAAKDIADGNMRAILSLFYSLSQHKRSKSGGTAVRKTTLCLWFQVPVDVVYLFIFLCCCCVYFVVYFLFCCCVFRLCKQYGKS